MRTAIPRASRSPMLRWPRSPSSVTRFTASGTTPSHPTSSHLEAVIPRHTLSGAWLRAGLDDAHALSQCLTGSVPPQQALQRGLLALAEIQSDGLGFTRHGAPPGSVPSTLLAWPANALTFLTHTTSTTVSQSP